MCVCESAPLVDLPPVTYRDHQDEEDTVADLIDNPVITGPHSPLTVAPDQLLGAAGTRLRGKEFDRGLHSSQSSAVQLPQLPNRGGRDLNPVRHARPRWTVPALVEGGAYSAGS